MYAEDSVRIKKNFIDIDLVNFVFEQKNGAHVTYG